MAHTDACKIQATEFTRRLITNGMSLNKACKVTEKESDGIPASTIKRWWYEVTGTVNNQFKNEPPQLTPPPSDEIQENQDSEPSKTETVSDLSSHGGHREGAGRPTKYEQDTDALFQLKRWWKLASKRDQKTFINWIGTEES